jgi:hypothetical protein
MGREKGESDYQRGKEKRKEEGRREKRRREE